MANYGKNINLFFMDGVANGRIKCSLANWTGVAYKIPRTQLDKAKSIDYLNQTGVYFLFGTSDETGDPFVYVGQAGVRKNGKGIPCRLDEHLNDSKREYWTEVVAFTTSNDSFGPTEISYLENRFYNIADDARRYIVNNSNEPHPGNLTEEKESEMEEFIVYSKLVMGALGYKVFEPIVEKKVTVENGNSINDEPILHFKYSKAEAKGKRTSEGFVVFANSRIATEMTNSVPDTTKNQREKYKACIEKDGTLKIDMLFNSPSGAACFVAGSSRNGLTDWKNDKGSSLKEIEDKELD